MFTPEEIEARAFVMVRRGYDADEVGAFLRAVAEDVRRLQEDLAVAGRKADPLDGAMADAVAVVQSARESAARIESGAEQRAADRLRDLEDEVARRLERARSEARTILEEARDQAAAIIAEVNARKTLTEADIAAARNTWLRESAELDVLSRRRRSVLEEAQDSLEQWMAALRDIVVEARTSAGDLVTPEQSTGEPSAEESASAESTYPEEPVRIEAEVPVQESAEQHEHVEDHEHEQHDHGQHEHGHHEHQVYEGA
ncbi:MAG TPA: DivIVA domain-containing protein [Mycobacteriales bacterium]|nr:DivIVA domain-containing protein [Mycobacteriales bacterium]